MESAEKKIEKSIHQEWIFIQCSLMQVRIIRSTYPYRSTFVPINDK